MGAAARRTRRRREKNEPGEQRQAAGSGAVGRQRLWRQQVADGVLGDGARKGHRTERGSLAARPLRRHVLFDYNTRGVAAANAAAAAEAASATATATISDAVAGVAGGAAVNAADEAALQQRRRALSRQAGAGAAATAAEGDSPPPVSMPAAAWRGAEGRPGGWLPSRASSSS